MRVFRFGLTVLALALLGSTARAANDPPPVIVALMGGTLLSQAVDVCHINVAPEQLTALKTKLIQLKAQTTAVLGELPPFDTLTASDCPTGTGSSRLVELISIFNEKPNEEFASAFKQFADTQAKTAQAASPTPASPAPVATRPQAVPAPSASPEMTIGGWQVTQRPSDGVCSATREYKDADDDNKDNAAGFFIHVDRPDRIIVSFGYEGWEWDQDEKVTADFKTDKGMIFEKSNWKGSGKTALVSSFDGADAIMNKVSSGQKLFLTFDQDSEANFLIPNVGMALGAIKLCLSQK